ncbi:Dihydrofolate synthase / Folylpolyglutamate synthase [Anaerovibrio sp. JC8]|uniref:bifunctional folylpolyglutamate synthase/dihydrofolate synthase n=1 Tax=Anaerovibrio sp. JC8 TaxID=1240085 RepID=UPI000A0AF703|nr:folylpolyglutamate synthase/dihydrofolate synthase family protein [Anaerovibrio sp. JC8]ORU01381.1 Dihydrofolate synthase / Folylpolyglutamate synthase [Anaerovibrio sp. JC8]
MNYSEAMDYLEELNVFGMSLGLDRIKRLLDLMGNPQNTYKTIHITGTNGKGSVTCMVTEVLKKAGIKVGMYTSPHLDSYTERVVINGDEISREKLAAAITVVRDLCDFMVGEGDEHPTQFEVLTAAAFYLFSKEQVEYAVIEVGLGGLLDSTNVITPEVSVITNVSFEHADKCGGTLEGIARHKAGIIKPGVPAVTGAEGQALDIIRQAAADNKAAIYVAGQDFDARPVKPLGQLSIPPNLGNTSVGNMSPSMIDLQIEALSTLPYGRCESEGAATRTQLVEFTSRNDQMASLDYKLSLLGLHQVSNSALAAAAVMLLAVNDLRITQRALKQAMANVKWPGRFEVIPRDGFELIIDGAHNPAGIKTLRESLDYYYPDQQRIFVLGILRDKDFEGMLEILLRPEDRVIFTTPSSERAADPVELLECTKVEAKEAIGDPAKALERGQELAGSDTILVCTGSLYLIGYLRTLLK